MEPPTEPTAPQEVAVVVAAAVEDLEEVRLAVPHAEVLEPLLPHRLP